jgi:hypothetical protein
MLPTPDPENYEYLPNIWDVEYLASQEEINAATRRKWNWVATAALTFIITVILMVLL